MWTFCRDETMAKRVRVVADIAPELKRMLERKAAAEDRTVAAEIRRAIRQHVAEFSRPPQEQETDLADAKG